MPLGAILLFLAMPIEPAQDARPPESRHVAARLEPRVPADRGLRWSPKGATVALSRREDALHGSFALGPRGTPPVAVRLERSKEAAHFDVLSIDLDRDG